MDSLLGRPVVGGLIGFNVGGATGGTTGGFTSGRINIGTYITCCVLTTIVPFPGGGRLAIEPLLREPLRYDPPFDFLDCFPLEPP